MTAMPAWMFALSMTPLGGSRIRPPQAYLNDASRWCCDGQSECGLDQCSQPLLESEYRHLHVADGVLETSAAVRKVFDENFDNPREARRSRFSWDFWHVTHRDEDRPRSRVASGDKETAPKSQLDEPALDEFATLGDATAAAATRESSQLSSGYGAPDAVAGPGHGQQYTMLRTPAADYLEPALFEQLCDELTEYGRVHLGCDAITPPWIALYTDGCSQNFHTDAPHGPFAYVLSLTPPGAHTPQDGDAPGWFEGGETIILKYAPPGAVPTPRISALAGDDS